MRIPFLCSTIFLSTAVCIGLGILSTCSNNTPLKNQSALEVPQFSKVPEWAADAIWYQIFPDRFRNGDPTNDPTSETLEGTWPYVQPPGWQTSPWTSDWYKLQPWEVATDEDFWFNAQLRRYGGDLQGILDQLDYLSDLGVNALYLNPIFESPSLHKYGCSMWHHVDNNFGPDPEGDKIIWGHETPSDPSTWQWTAADSLFLHLLDVAHAKGFRVIIDGVFNHTGIPFWAFDDIRTKGPESEFADWFTILAYDDPATPEDEFDYQGWYGVKDLPELREDKHGPSQGVKEHLQAVVQRWMDPNGDGDPSDGIDGWRLDVAEMVAPNFWREFRGWCHNINPQAYLVGEVWWEDYSQNKMFNAAAWLQGDIFDAVMNYRFGDALLRGLVDQNQQVNASYMDSLLSLVRNAYPLQNQYVLMNMFNSHDTERLASMVSNPDRTIDHASSSRDAADFYLGPPSDAQLQLQKTMLMIQYAYPGAPLIYYGDEVGMWGADDPDCRKPMVWDDLIYESEASLPRGKSHGPFPVGINLELHAYYRSLNRLRQDLPVLRHGSYRTLLARGDHFIFERADGDSRVITLINLGNEVWDFMDILTEFSGPAPDMLFNSVGDKSESILPKGGRIYRVN